MELIASKVKSDSDYPAVDRLYEQCTSAITSLHTSQNNPFITSSLENLLATLSFQQSLLESRRHGQSRFRTFSEGQCSHLEQSKRSRNDYMRTCSESIDRGSDRSQAIESMVIENVEGVSLDDVVGLEDVKQILRESVIMPVQYSQLFQGGAKPWTKLLLYGPPGTGKTKIARALAAELHCPFYCVSSASLLSSWIGESEKLIKELFQHARRKSSQCIIFIDEIDGLCRKRSQTEDEHSRRVKTELLRQIEGLEEEKSLLFLLGATNCPWDIDPAFLRRFQRRIFVPLPDREGRRSIICNQFKSAPLEMSESEWSLVLDATAGYSGADLIHMTMAAAFSPIRELQSSRFWKFTSDNKITPCSSDNLGAMQYPLSKLPANQVIARAVQQKDFMSAIKTTPRTVSAAVLQQFEEFSSS